jgi:hypothetical protein
LRRLLRLTVDTAVTAFIQLTQLPPLKFKRQKKERQPAATASPAYMPQQLKGTAVLAAAAVVASLEYLPYALSSSKGRAKNSRTNSAASESGSRQATSAGHQSSSCPRERELAAGDLVINSIMAPAGFAAIIRRPHRPTPPEQQRPGQSRAPVKRIGHSCPRIRAEEEGDACLEQVGLALSGSRAVPGARPLRAVSGGSLTNGLIGGRLGLSLIRGTGNLCGAGRIG